MSASSLRAKRVVVIFTAILLISLGLCGANYAAFAYFGLGFSGGSAPGPHGNLKDDAGLALTFAAFAELVGMIVGAAGLVVSFVAWLAVVATEKYGNSSGPTAMSEGNETRRMTSKKWAALSATLLLVSLGLCGANFFLVLRFVPLSGPGPQPGQPSPPNWRGNVLTVTGVLELIGIAQVSSVVFRMDMESKGVESKR